MIGDTVNTKTISTGLVALLMIIMALAPSIMNVEELNDNIVTEYGHESVPSGPAHMSGILSWQDDAWNATWTCSGGLAGVTPSDWDDFVSSGEEDPHNYTSWGINLTGAGSYATGDAPAGTWVITAGLTCTDDAGVWRSAGGQFGDSHESPDWVNLSNDSDIGDVSFMLIEHGEGMGGGGLTFVCGNGTQIAFGKVNNEIQDCEDGADEQQYDVNGTEINWFDCSGGTDVWIHQVNDGTDDCPEGDDEMHSDDMGGDGPTFVCGNGDEIAFGKVNNGLQDCEDGADEQQYDVNGTEINWFDCSGGTDVWIHQVNDGTDDCPEGDDEMHSDGGGEMDCDKTYIEFHLVTSALGGVNFVFDMVCEFSVEQSNEYREFIDTSVGNSDGEVNATEVAAFMEMMNNCYDEDGTVIVCDESCYGENGTVIACDENTDDEEWSINGVVMEMYDTGAGFDQESILGDGRIVTVNAMNSQHVDLIDGQEEVTVTFVNNDNDDDDDNDDDECFTVQVLPSGDWSPTSVLVEPAEDWNVLLMDGEEEEVFAGYDFYGCSTPDTFTAVFEYTGEGHPNGVENLPPVCEFMWFMDTDTTFENGSLVTEGPDGDVEIELGAGSYMISVWCTDAEMDSIQVTWEAPDLNLSSTYDGEGEVNGWVMFIVPPGLSENIVVPYSWTSEEWNGSGDFIIILDSGEGLGGDIEGEGGALPGFTSLMTITALLGAVFILGKRDCE